MKIRLLSTIFFLFFSFSAKLFSQEITEPSYKLEFLKATYEEFQKPNPYKNQIVIYLKYSKKKGDMALMSTRFKYRIDENDEEITEILEKSKHNITVYGTANTKRKPHELYNILKDKFDFGTKETPKDFIFAFYLRDITDSYIPTMDFVYGLWEPTNQKIRIEQNFKINIEKK